MLRALTARFVPDFESLPEIEPLSRGWLLDIEAFHAFEIAQLRKRQEESEE